MASSPWNRPNNPMASKAGIVTGGTRPMQISGTNPPLYSNPKSPKPKGGKGGGKGGRKGC